MPTFDEVWNRIEMHAGDDFQQKKGRIFTYQARQGYIVPNTTNRNLPRSQFRTAYEMVPLAGPGQINHLQGPAYIFAILMDPRIRQEDW